MMCKNTQHSHIYNPAHTVYLRITKKTSKSTSKSNTHLNNVMCRPLTRADQLLRQVLFTTRLLSLELAIVLRNNAPIYQRMHRILDKWNALCELSQYSSDIAQDNCSVTQKQLIILTFPLQRLWPFPQPCVRDSLDFLWTAPPGNVCDILCLLVSCAPPPLYFWNRKGVKNIEKCKQRVEETCEANGKTVDKPSLISLTKKKIKKNERYCMKVLHAKRHTYTNTFQTFQTQHAQHLPMSSLALLIITVEAKMSSNMSFSFCLRLIPMSSTAFAMN